MRKNYLSNEQILQDFGALFLNLTKETELAIEMASYGYDKEKVAEGKALYDKANELYLKNKKENADETTASLEYRKKLDELLEIYTNHRKRAKVVFRDQADTLKLLALSGSASRNRAGLLKEIEILYVNLNDNETLLNEVKIMKISAEDIKSQIQRLNDVQTAHANYLQEKGESQQATKDKNEAFAKLEKWVRNLYAVAKIALEDKPQLLEGIGKIIKS